MRGDLHKLALALGALILFILLLEAVEANGRWGGARPGIIDDRPQTVRDIEDRADINWAYNTASKWIAEDQEACLPYANNSFTPKSWSLAYTNCMVERNNVRILYMLRRNCTGVDTIASVCKMEDE